MALSLLAYNGRVRVGRGREVVGARSGLTVLLAISSLVLFVVAAAWIVSAITEQEAAGQTRPASPTNSASPAALPAPEGASRAPSLVPAGGLEDHFGDAFESASASVQADEPEGIPDLTVMNVIGDAEHYPVDGGLLCEGPIVGDGDRTVWVCSSAHRGGRDSYGLVVVGDDPLTIFSVEATARGASEEEAASFFAHVGALCLDETDPLNPEAWVRENVPTGGQTFAEGAELSVYGTKEARTLQVVAREIF
jgi:hypothetical protein